MLGRMLQWLLSLIRLFLTAFREFLPALLALWRDFLARLRRRGREKGLSEREGRRSRRPCVPIDSPAYKKPDPLIYSQEYLMKLGIGVTWDNPDIKLYRNGGFVPSGQLKANTDYDVVATVWNNSTEAPIADLPVRFSYRSFGVGAQETAIGDTQVLLGVKGGANHPAFATMKWHTPSSAGHYCIKVLLDWLDDANPNNNLGQENTNVGKAQSPAKFTFLLHNPTKEVQKYRFAVDTYQIPGRQPCPPGEDDVERRLIVGTSGQSLTAHDPARFPLPANWKVAINPQNPELGSGMDKTIKVTVTVPDDFRGRQPININSFNSYGLAGGVTLYVEGK